MHVLTKRRLLTVTCESKSRIPNISIRPFLIYPAIPAYPFLDKTFHAKQRGISSSLSLFHYFRHLYTSHVFESVVPTLMGNAHVLATGLLTD